MLKSIFTAPLLLASALALPGGGWGSWGNQPCLNDASVQNIISGYTYLLRFPGGADFNSTANALLSDKFFVSSDSINQLAGIPVGFRHSYHSYPFTNKQLARCQRLPKQAGFHRRSSSDSSYSTIGHSRLLLHMRPDRLEMERFSYRQQQV